MSLWRGRTQAATSASCRHEAAICPVCLGARQINLGVAVGNPGPDGAQNPSSRYVWCRHCVARGCTLPLLFAVCTKASHAGLQAFCPADARLPEPMSEGCTACRAWHAWGTLPHIHQHRTATISAHSLQELACMQAFRLCPPQQPTCQSALWPENCSLPLQSTCCCSHEGLVWRIKAAAPLNISYDHQTFQHIKHL